MENFVVDRILVKTVAKTGLRQSLRRFAKADDGALIIFGLILFVLMAMMGGIAVDLMRYETTRTTLQNTLDRSTLAAASLSQDLDPEAVVRDYVAKAGLSEHLTDVSVDEGLNYREVSAAALADTTPFFLHMIGIDEFTAPGASTAEQRISNVEVMLVLDVSGSMAGTKMTNLKSAASEFVDTVLSSDGEDRISIGLVPYNGQVNLGSTMAAKYNIPIPQVVANTNCVDLPASVYSATTMSRTLDLPRTAYADTFSTTSQSTSYVSTSSGAPNANNRWCPPSAVNVVRPPINDIATLQGYINNLTAIGATSINAGLKWGLTLLDPDTRPIFDELAGAGVIPSVFDVRPFEYDDEEAMKVIVLMTDGSHFAEERVNTAFKTGNSPIYKANDGYFSIRHTAGRPAAAGTNEYFVPHLCTSTNCMNGTDTSSAWRATSYRPAGGNATQQTWPQVWNDLRVTYVAWQMYARALGTSSTTRTNNYNTAMTAFRTLTPTTTMDSQLQGICSLAKEKENMVIYGIAFDAPAAGAAQIKMCTSGYDAADPNGENPYYFASSPTNIKTAFRAIATNISQLRLTQ